MSEPILDPNSSEIKTIGEIVRRIRPHMQCNCDLDSWQPEQSTGHSHVCRIHRLAEEIALILLRKGMSRRIKELEAEKQRREQVIEDLLEVCKAQVALDLSTFADIKECDSVESLVKMEIMDRKATEIRQQMQATIAKAEGQETQEVK